METHLEILQQLGVGTTVREGSDQGDQLRTPTPETTHVSQYFTEGFKGAPQLGPPNVERRKPLGQQPTNKFQSRGISVTLTEFIARNRRFGTGLRNHRKLTHLHLMCQLIVKCVNWHIYGIVSIKHTYSSLCFPKYRLVDLLRVFSLWINIFL